MNAFYLDLKTCKFLDVSLKRNEINTFDSRLMKFDWDYSFHTFYSIAQMKSIDRPFSTNPKSGMFNQAMFIMTITLSD